MGAERVTTLNLFVERVDGDQHLLMVRGAVPGRAGVVRDGPQGRGGQARAEAAGREGEEGQEVAMTLDIVNAQNEKIGSLELRDEVFGGRVKADLIWQSVVRDNAADAPRHARDEDPRAGQRHRQEALQAEGHGPRAGRRGPQPAVAQGRHRVRAAAAQLRLRDAAQAGARGAARRRWRRSCRRARWWWSRRSPTVEKTKAAAEMLARFGAARQRRWSWT